MSQGEGGGRPRKHSHDPAIGQYALDAEWQEIADENTEAIMIRNKYGSLSPTALVEAAGDKAGRYAAITLAIMDIAKDADTNDIDTLYDCVDRYIKLCVDHNILITNLGCYGACGVSRQTITDWAQGRSRASHDPQYKEFALRVRMLCSINREQMMVEGKINPIIAIWWEKNFDGFTDRPGDVIADTDEAQELSASEIASKYAGIGDD